MQYPLKGAGGFWCVDNSGNSKTENAFMPAAAVVCA